MEINKAVKTLSALAHEGRLSLMRRLIQAGPEGLTAGELAQFSNISPTTASGQLLVLTNADLVTPQRQGRYIRYSANFSEFMQLTHFLTEDCCAGRQDLLKSLEPR